LLFQDSLEVHLASGSDEQIYFELDIEDGGFGANIQYTDQSESGVLYSHDAAPVHDDFPAQLSESDQSGNVVSRRSRRHRIESISILPGERRSLFIFVIPNLAVEIDAGIVNNIPETSAIASDALAMLAVLGTPRLFRFGFAIYRIFLSIYFLILYQIAEVVSMLRVSIIKTGDWTDIQLSFESARLFSLQLYQPRLTLWISMIVKLVSKSHLLWILGIILALQLLYLVLQLPKVSVFRVTKFTLVRWKQNQ
jgi:hypothetical protein